MKSINELVREYAEDWALKNAIHNWERMPRTNFVGDAVPKPTKGDHTIVVACEHTATFATNLTFERLVEALKNERVISSYDYLDPSQWADWLVKNREKILNGGGNEHS